MKILELIIGTSERLPEYVSAHPWFFWLSIIFAVITSFIYAIRHSSAGLKKYDAEFRKRARIWVNTPVDKRSKELYTLEDKKIARRRHRKFFGALVRATALYVLILFVTMGEEIIEIAPDVIDRRFFVEVIVLSVIYLIFIVVRATKGWKDFNMAKMYQDSVNKTNKFVGGESYVDYCDREMAETRKEFPKLYRFFDHSFTAMTWYFRLSLVFLTVMTSAQIMFAIVVLSSNIDVTTWPAIGLSAYVASVLGLVYKDIGVIIEPIATWITRVK